MEPFSIVIGGGILFAWLRNRNKKNISVPDSDGSSVPDGDGSSVPAGDDPSVPAGDGSADEAYQKWLQENSKVLEDIEKQINDYKQDYNEVEKDNKFVNETVNQDLISFFDFSEKFDAVGTKLEDFYNFTDSETLASLGISFETGLMSNFVIENYQVIRFRIDSVVVTDDWFKNRLHTFTLKLRIFNPTNSVVNIPFDKFKIKKLTYGYKKGYPVVFEKEPPAVDFGDSANVNKIKIGEKDGVSKFEKKSSEETYYQFCKKYDTWSFFVPKIESVKEGSVNLDSVVIDAYDESIIKVTLQDIALESIPENPKEFSVDIYVSDFLEKRSGLHEDVSIIKMAKPAIYNKNANYDLNAMFGMSLGDMLKLSESLNNE